MRGLRRTERRLRPSAAEPLPPPLRTPAPGAIMQGTPLLPQLHGLLRRVASRLLAAEMSMSVITTPSMRLSTVR